ncbi:hypothetical protein EON65_12965 [archaeon]|nr:MAG: hypothetical protein EON65_12965 [archaeon]
MESQDVSDECNVASSNYRFDKNEAETRLAVERSMMRDKGTSERQQTYKIDMPYNKGHNHNLYVSNHPQDPTDEKNDYHIEIVDASQSNEIDEGDQPDENPDEQPKDIEESERNHSSQLENEMSQVILGFHESDVFHLATCYSDYHVATGLEDLIQTLRIDRYEEYFGCLCHLFMSY